MYACAVVRRSCEDQKEWLEVILPELEALVTTSTLRKAEPQAVKSAQATGAPTAPWSILFVSRPGAVLTTVKHKARLVMCGN